MREEHTGVRVRPDPEVLLAAVEGSSEAILITSAELDRAVLHWTWNEHDGGPVALPTREGFGSRLLNRVLTVQVGAKVDIAYDPDGLRIDVGLPMLLTSTVS